MPECAVVARFTCSGSGVRIGRIMMRTLVVFSCGLVVGVAVQSGAAQDRRLPGNNGINHLAFATSRYAEMKQFYTETLGFPEAFSNTNAEGQPTLTYFQASRNTFIELMPAGTTRPSGFTHLGLHVADVRAVAARLRERGLQVGEPRIIGSGSLTVGITDPDGNRLEVSELPPNAPARKAMDAWK
jgi:lactoylglutathione lyase